MWPFDPKHHHGHQGLRKKEVELLEEAVKLERQEVGILEKAYRSRLSSIKVAFTEKNMGTTVTPVPGPVVMDVGDVVSASLIGFDQFGKPFTGPMPAENFSIDNQSIASLDTTDNEVTGVSAGVANVTGSLTTAEGLALSDTETVTVNPAVVVPPPTPVLSSVKVAFTPVSQAAPAASASARTAARRS